MLWQEVDKLKNPIAGTVSPKQETDGLRWSPHQSLHQCCDRFHLSLNVPMTASQPLVYKTGCSGEDKTCPVHVHT